MDTPNLRKATFASGCFWCYEAVFRELRGVKDVIVGYAGGKTENPTYEEVSAETTGHAEAYQVTYDPSEISYEDLLDVFWYVHDPTQLNRQGNDYGTQYRSEIFYHNDEQKKLAEQSLDELEEEEIYEDDIVTKISELKVFYPAEDYHQRYFENNPEAGYCQAIIKPKIEKFEKKFKSLLKK